MSFKVVVFIKQVPDTEDIRWTEQNTIQRDGLESVINPFDIGAIQLASNIKNFIPETEIIVATMGPLQARDALKQAIAMGCDKAYLLNDKKFAGSDTLATAYVLSKFIQKVVPDFNLIICGQQAVDGDTAQTPSSMAEKLSIQQICSVVDVKNVTSGYSIWSKNTASVFQDIKIKHPCLVSTNLKYVELLPDIDGYIKAQNSDITMLTADDIGAETQYVGFVGSPTQVKKAFRPEITRATELVENAASDDIANLILEEITKCRVKND